MRAFSQTCLGCIASRVVPVLAVFCLILSSKGDQFSLVPVPPSSDEPNWILGPGKASLGDFATLQIPEGFRFTDARGARSLLMRMRNPVPQNLIGLLTPDSGKCWVVIDYSEIGHLKDLNEYTRIDANKVLKAVRLRLNFENALRTRQGAQPISSVDWSVAPVLDPARDTLEWAIRAETRTDKIVDLQEVTETNEVVNHTIRLIGNQRVLGLTAVQADQIAAASIPLKELTEGIVFNPGEKYSDYKLGDKLAKVSLEQLIAGEDSPIPQSPYLWIGIWSGAGVLVLGLGITGVILIRRSLRREKMSRAFPEYTEHPHFLTPFFGNGKHEKGLHRHKAFNYQKFYSDMMSEVSGGHTVLQPGVPNGNGSSQKAARKLPDLVGRPALSPAEAGVNQAIIRANLDLIANQNHLIEEQKRLLQEQTRLIDEKSRLIQEKNQLLEKQSELFERDLL